MFIADLANIDAAGKLNLIGLFSAIRPQQLPIRVPLFFFIIMFEADQSEIGKNVTLKIDFLGDIAENGLEPTSIPLEIPNQLNGTGIVEMHAIVQMSGTVFRSAGLYTLNIFIDGQKEHSAVLTVFEPQQGVNPHVV